MCLYSFFFKDILVLSVVENRGSVLEWGMRLRIAVGAAKGLSYLHEDCEFFFFVFFYSSTCIDFDFLSCD